MYAAGAFGCVAFGLYWKRANVIGAYCSLGFGAVAPIGFLVLEQMKTHLPASMLFIVDVNVSGLMSFVLAVHGMVIGSLLTQRSHPPVLLQAHKEGT
jgi:Na+(H+)/acetate symporter ActP